MKRSEINEAIRYAIAALDKRQFPLPPFAFYTPEHWKTISRDEEELVENMLGWDVTDFGSGDFSDTGLTIFTFRNGNFRKREKYPKPYAEKMLFVRDGQILPFHYHWSKREDIINRGGGDLAITLYNSSPTDFTLGRAEDKGTFLDTPVKVSVDGKSREVQAGGEVILKPGESISISQGLYHRWQGVKGTGDVVLFEVSMTNDDNVDNRFYESLPRIPEIEEDAPPEFLIFADYPKYTPFTF